MINSHTNRIVWGTETVEFPPLRTTDNGWYYGYDGEVLGRGSAGSQAARNLMTERRMGVLAAHDWKIPDAIGPEFTSSYDYSMSKGLKAWYKTEGLGTITISYNPKTEQMGLMMHSLLWELHKQAPHHVSVSQSRECKAKPQAVSMDMWEYARQVFPELERLNTPTVRTTFKQQGELEMEDGSWTVAQDHYSYFRVISDEKLETIRSKHLTPLVEVFAVFGHENVRLHTNWTNNSKGHSIQVIEAVEIKVKADDHEEYHTVKIESGGAARISCGFRESEEKYLQYQKRQLSGWAREVSDTFEDFVFDD